jgi:flagellar hook protein FlgE
VSASSADLNGGTVNINGNNTFGMTFNGQGQMTSAGTLNLTFSQGTPWNVPGTTIVSNATQAQVNLNLNNAAVGSLTSFATCTSVSSQADPGNPGQAGQGAAALKSFSIGPDGTVRGEYANGTTKTLGQIQLATFTNPAGLQRIGQNDFDVSSDSGAASITNPGAGAAGTVAQGSIETSNVQLADQLSGMILAERGFQANSRMVTTSDEMLQDVVQMKR